MSLKEELKMTRDFASLQQEALLALARTQNVIEPFFSSILSQYKLTAPQFNILRILRGNKSEEGMSCTEIGERMVTRDSDITRLLDKLAKANLIERHRPEHDRRKVLTKITQNGIQLIEEIVPHLDRANQSCLGHIDDTTLQTLVDILDRIRQPHL